MSKMVLTKANFDSVVKNNPIVVIDFWAPWCEPCKSFSDIFNEVAKLHEDKLFCDINIDEQKDLAQEFAITSIPFVMVIKNRTIVYAESGALSETALSDLVDQAGYLDIEAKE